MLSRSQFLRTAAAAALTCGGAALAPAAEKPLQTGDAPSAENAGSGDEQAASPAQTPAGSSADAPRTFAVMSDPHYISPRLTDNGPAFTEVVEAGDGKVMLKIKALLDAFVSQLLRERPDALIVTGDLAFNGARESHEDLAAKLAPLLDAGIRVAVLPGNHDIACSQAARFEGDSWEHVASVTAEEFRAIWERFGFADAWRADEASLSYAWPLYDDVWVLMLDSFGSQEPGALGPQTLAWVGEVLAEAAARGVRVIGASHQNLRCHCSLFGDLFMLDDAAELDGLFCEAGVRLNLSGHIHVQHTAAAAAEGGAFEAATSSLAVTPNQYTLAELSEQGLLSCRCVAVDVAAWAAETGADDPDLADWDAYTASFFDACCRIDPYDELVESGMDAEAAAATTAAVRAMNRHYFAGRTDLIDWSDPDLAAAFGHTSLEAYLQVVRTENPHDHTVYEVQL